MSITNIKELFCKRVSEAEKLNTNPVAQSKQNGSGKEEKSCESSFSSLSEKDAGITEFIRSGPGFTAVIKQRFSDFQVHEIDTDNVIVYLTDFEIPKETVTEVSDDILDSSTWKDLGDLLSKEKDTVEIEVTDFDKEKRRNIHKAIKNKFGSSIHSNTVEKENKKYISVSKANKNSHDRSWPDDLGKYLHFVLYKENKDTFDAINLLSSKLRIKAQNFTYSGTKDKRAKTSQRISVWHLDAARLNSLNSNLRGMKVGNFIYKDNPLKLGDLKGNYFEVALRNITAPDELIEKSLSEVKNNGFINYFGLQRFGSSAAIPTYEIGKALVKGDFKTAVELILKPREEKTAPDLKEARKVWWDTRNAGKAFQVLKAKKRTNEGKLLAGLSKHGQNAYINALDEIPRNVRLLYLHSYQSLIWNKIVSKRIQTFGLSVLEGDLIFSDNTGIKKELTDDETSDDSVIPAVRCLSAEEVKNFTIFDVVTPLPGYNVTYPSNVIKQWYEELLAVDGLSSEKLKQTVKQYSLSGTYRSTVKGMKDLSWEIVEYSTIEEDLILSDFDKLNEKDSMKSQGDGQDTSEKDETKQSTELGDKHKALLLRFSLDPSTYATMAFREILKIDTSSSHQASLNVPGNKRVCDSEDDNELSEKKPRMST